MEKHAEHTARPFLPVTASAQGLGGLPLGSLHSRAAARAVLEQRHKGEDRWELILIGRPDDDNLPVAHDWSTQPDRTQRRTVIVPFGVTLVVGLRALGGYSESESTYVPKARPEELECCEMLNLVRRA